MRISIMSEETHVGGTYMVYHIIDMVINNNNNNNINISKRIIIVLFFNCQNVVKFCPKWNKSGDHFTQSLGIFKMKNKK